jgi:hypothetical protein
MNNYLDNKNGDWYLFAKSFLNIAELAAREIRVRDGRKYFENKLLYNEELFIPIIFNIKHSIEVLLKTLIVTIEWDGLKKEDKGHNLSELFIKFENRYKNINFSKVQHVISKAFKNDPNNNYLIIANNDIKKFNEDAKITDYLRKLKKLILKYHKCEFLKEKIPKILISLDDYKNDVFRYPQNSLNCRIDYHELIKNINIDDNGDIDKILNDIKKLKDYYCFEFLLFIYNEYKK